MLLFTPVEVSRHKKQGRGVGKISRKIEIVMKEEKKRSVAKSGGNPV
jgi:hypothetical protein